ALRDERKSDIDRSCGLADAALARAHGDDALDAIDPRLALRLGAAMAELRGIGLFGGDRDHHLAAAAECLGPLVRLVAGRAKSGLHAGRNSNGESYGTGGDDDF